jgi:hypothetical protein
VGAERLTAQPAVIFPPHEILPPLTGYLLQHRQPIGAKAMNKFNLALIVTIAAVTMSASARPAAAIEYPWCANYGGDDGGGGTNCGFTTLEQCRATVSGTGGYCAHNQFYVGPTASQQQRKRKHSNAN